MLDLAEGLFKWRLWSLMGWQDIRQRYRRSILGPFWLTLSMGVLVGTMPIQSAPPVINTGCGSAMRGLSAWWCGTGSVGAR